MGLCDLIRSSKANEKTLLEPMNGARCEGIHLASSFKVGSVLCVPRDMKDLTSPLTVLGMYSTVPHIHRGSICTYMGMYVCILQPH